MLTLKVISQETEKVLKGLEKKHFKNAKETIEKVLELDKERRAAQQELDTVFNVCVNASAVCNRLDDGCKG